MKLIGIGVLLAASATVLSAQASQFVLSSRDRAQLLVVDFVATGPDGAPLTSLSPSDVTIRLGGRVRTVQALEYVPAASTPHTNVPPAFADNAEPGAPRSIVLMVDQDTIRPGQTVVVRDAIQRLLTGLAPRERVALVTVPFGGLAVDLTTNHALIMQAVSGLSPQGSRAETDGDAQCRTLNTLGAMTDLLLRLSVVEDPVTVVFFSGHLEGPAGTIRMTGRTPVGGICDLQPQTFKDLGAAAARARARFFVVHADMNQRGRGLNGLEDITGVTGGPLLFLESGGGAPAISRILNDTTGYFVARVARDPQDRVGEVLGVNLSANRPGVTLWRNPSFVITRPPAVISTAPAGAPPSVADLIRQPQLARDLPLQVAVHAFGSGSADRIRLAVALTSPAGTSPLTSAIVGAFDATGQMVGGIEMTADALAREPAAAALDVPPGVYIVRVAAVDGTGRAGSVELPVEAGLTPIGSGRASDLLVGLSREGSFVPALTFGDEPTAFAMVEVYDTPPSLRATFEVAATTNGPALLTMPGLVEVSSGRAIVTAVLPLTALADGDYVVRATLTPGNSASARILRGLRKNTRR